MIGGTSCRSFLSVQNEYMNNCKVAQSISSRNRLFNKEKGTSFEVTIEARRNIIVKVDILADENLNISNYNITQYDLAVMDSAYTLYVNGMTSFTPEMIVRTMSGDMGQTVSPQMVEAVTRSLDKLKFIRIRINCTDEMIARKRLKKGQTATMESFLMPLKELEVKVGNQKIMHGYQFLEKPVLYTYAERLNQIINVPVDIFDLHAAAINDTYDVIVIKRYLIRRIEAMKNKNNNISSKRISYEWFDKNAQKEKGMFQHLGYKREYYSKWRTKKSSIHQTATVILKAFVEKGYIKSFAEVKEGNSINGFDIEL